MHVHGMRGPAGAELDVESVAMPPGQVLRITVRNPGPEPITLDRVQVELRGRPERVLEHGWQSWSLVRRTSPDDVRPERRRLALPLRQMLHSEPNLVGEAVCGDQFLLSDLGLVGFLGARRHLSTVLPTRHGQRAVAWLDGIELDPGAEWELDPLWFAAGSPGPVYSSYLNAWANLARPRPACNPGAGWCSWYEYFDRITEAEIATNTELALSHGLRGVQLDDGYQAELGSWLATNGKFPSGTVAVADRVIAGGAWAGIWTAPFLASSAGSLAGKHPKWLLGSTGGRPSVVLPNTGWGGDAAGLDPGRPAVREHLTETFAALREQGFSYFKIDFLYAGALPGSCATGRLTRAQIYRLGLQAIRDGIGDSAYLLGCGAPLGPSVGLVDAMRIGPDVAPNWLPEPAEWPGFTECQPSALNAIRASVLRAPMHARLFVNDPDCLLLRPTGTGLSAAQRKLLATVIEGSGGFVMVSDNLARYGPAQWTALRDLAERTAGAASETLDLDDPFADTINLRAADRTLTVSWHGRPVARLC